MLEQILNNPYLIGLGAIAIISVIGILAYTGTGGLLLLGTVFKGGLAYLYKAAYPAIIVLRQKSPYKIAAVGLAFSNFFIYLYSFIQTGNLTLIDSALNALGATLVGGFNQMTTGGWVLLQNPGSPLKIITAIVMIVLGFATLSLWFIGWKFAKRRVPELTYYILVFTLLLALSWSFDGLNSVFEMLDLIEVASETANTNSTMNATEAAGGTVEANLSSIS